MPTWFGAEPVSRSLSLLRLNLRRRCEAWWGDEALLSHAWMQRVLGYIAQGRLAVDHLAACPFEYDYYSEIGRQLFFQGRFEEAEIRFFEHLLKGQRAPVILEIGANVGLHTVRWARACPGALLFAFEPSPGTGEILERNAQRWARQAQVVIRREAVSETAGTATLYEFANNAYTSLKDTGCKQLVRTIEVPVTTIDRFVMQERLTTVSLIKIDVDGLETEVLRGGLETLVRLRPDLLVETYGGKQSNPAPEVTVELLGSLGYRVYVLVDGNPVQYKKHSDTYYNYWFSCRPQQDPAV